VGGTQCIEIDTGERFRFVAREPELRKLPGGQVGTDLKSVRTARIPQLREHPRRPVRQWVPEERLLHVLQVLRQDRLRLMEPLVADSSFGRGQRTLLTGDGQILVGVLQEQFP
jgi:hypothetical protein